MKTQTKMQGEYVAPETRTIITQFEGTLCASSGTEDLLPSGSLEGYGTEDSFSGWGN